MEGLLDQLESLFLLLERSLAALITRPTVQLARTIRAALRHFWSRLLGLQGYTTDEFIVSKSTAVAVISHARHGHDNGILTLPLLTLTLNGLSQYLRWISAAHAFGVRIPAHRKAVVASLFLLLPNLLVPLIHIRLLHLLLTFVVAANNCFLYREYCIHQQLQWYGRRLPGEPLVMAVLQGINAAHEVVIGPGQVVARMVRPYLPQLLSFPPANSGRLKI